jgi:hypothetical protein
MSTHPSPQELRRKWKAANAEPADSPQRVEAYRELAQCCPAFVPGLLALGRARASPAEAEGALRTAAEVSAGAPEPLIELGHFLGTVQGNAVEAERAFASAASAALELLEEAWAGWIRALGEQGQLDAALEVEERARATFPGSVRITQAVESARRAASR